MAFSATLTASSLSARQVPSPGPGMGLRGSEADKAGVPCIPGGDSAGTEDSGGIFKEEGGGAV